MDAHPRHVCGLVGLDHRDKAKYLTKRANMADERYRRSVGR